jgi:phosphoglycolate phosphatase
MSTLPRYILFDLDGTLIDGVPDLLASINSVMVAHALPALLRPALEAMLGDGMRILVQRAFAAQGVTLEPAAFEAACAAYVAAYRATDYRHTRLYDGVAATLQQLHSDGWTIGLASNKPTQPCEAILTQLGIRHYFSAVAGGDATTVRKPDPGHLHHALQQLGHDRYAPARAVMVGDHANDVDAARAAGLAAIAVALETDPARAHSLGADAVLTDFRSLPAALAALHGKSAGLWV